MKLINIKDKIWPVTVELIQTKVSDKIWINLTRKLIWHINDITSKVKTYESV